MLAMSTLNRKSFGKVRRVLLRCLQRWNVTVQVQAVHTVHFQRDKVSDKLIDVWHELLQVVRILGVMERNLFQGIVQGIATDSAGCIIYGGDAR